MVKTESVGEARGLMEVMDNCDAVVVAGGDGAITEAVTGLLRRNDSGLAVQRFPIGITMNYIFPFTFNLKICFILQV